jgi:hypothetical protein
MVHGPNKNDHFSRCEQGLGAFKDPKRDPPDRLLTLGNTNTDNMLVRGYVLHLTSITPAAQKKTKVLKSLFFVSRGPTVPTASPQFV